MTTDEEKEGTVFLMVCGGLLAFMLVAVVWVVSTRQETMEEESTLPAGWHHFGKGIIGKLNGDTSYLIENVHGPIVEFTERATCTGSICTDMNQLAGEDLGPNAYAEIAVTLDCDTRKYGGSVINIYSEEGAKVASSTLEMEDWDFDEHSWNMDDRLMTRVCKEEVWSKEDS